MKMFKKIFQKISTPKPLNTKAYPRGYTDKELEELIDKYGDLNADKFNIGPSYFSKAVLGLTELERRSAAKLGWWTLSVSVLALVLSFLAVKYAAEQTQFTELQSRSDRIFQMQAIQEARKECEQYPTYESDNSIWSRIMKIFTN